MPSATASSSSAKPTPSSVPAESPSPTVVEQSPAETPVKAVNPPAPSVTAGTSCGPSNTGRTTLVLAEGSAPCNEVQQTFADFNAQFQGGIAPVTIGDYTCRSYTPEDTKINGRTVSCTGKGNRLEAMTVYPLGGTPLAAESYYTSRGDVYFRAQGIGCHIGDFGVDCERPNLDDPMKGVIQFFGHSKQGIPVIGSGGGNPGSTPYYDGTTLSPGQSISAFGSACVVDPTYVTCTNGSQQLSANATEFIPQ
ncbi:hypothetical protein [Rothia sp. ZJ1223]|uniref:hypothetical protein n=1 Tax=Rothia sp. ZJ1223 TaxID=2811098 RepID=UPI00195D9A73|nr:hypothetical protein [Rothia sp. ZJ1223]MBM7050805.1 hypothetical protein [Rothia sp. ZJ1223]